MEREDIILDASVAVKWFTQEEHHDKAITIRDKFIKGEIEIIVPDLILYELANALRYNPNFNSKDVEDSIQSILDLELTITTPMPSILQKAIETAFAKDITIYDSVYMALAQNLNCKLITADRRLYDEVKDLGFVTLLE